MKHLLGVSPLRLPLLRIRSPSTVRTSPLFRNLFIKFHTTHRVFRFLKRVRIPFSPVSSCFLHRVFPSPTPSTRSCICRSTSTTDLSTSVVDRPQGVILLECGMGLQFFGGVPFTTDPFLKLT